MIQDAVNRISYDGNGIATEFAFPFSITTIQDVKVMLVDTDGTETILTSDYTVDDVNSKVTYPGYPAGEEPPLEDRPPILAEGQRIVIYRDLDITQLTSLFNQYPFKTIELMIDKTTILLQQLQDAQQRALTLSVATSTDVSSILPAPSALKSFRWDAAGTGLELTADPATVLASVQGYTEQAEGYATSATTQAGIATTGANTATTQAGIATQAAATMTLATQAEAEAGTDNIKRMSPLRTLQAISPHLGIRNKIINGNFVVNQRAVSGTVTLAAGIYGHDRWKAGTSGCTYTFATVENKTTITISAGSLIQVIEGLNLQSGTHTLSWSGTAQGKIGTGSYGSTGVTGFVTGGTDTNIEFGTGTLSNVQFESGSVATVFEQRLIGTELILCQRYYAKVATTIRFHSVSSDNNINVSVPFPTEMRTIPTTSVVSSCQLSSNVSSFSIQLISIRNIRIELISSAAGACYALDGIYAVSAEL